MKFLLSTPRGNEVSSQIVNGAFRFEGQDGEDQNGTFKPIAEMEIGDLVHFDRLSVNRRDFLTCSIYRIS